MTLFPANVDKITDILRYKGLYFIVRHEDSCEANCLLCFKTVRLESHSKAKTLEQRSIKFANFLSHLYTNHPSELCETDWLSEKKARTQTKKTQSATNSESKKTIQMAFAKTSTRKSRMTDKIEDVKSITKIFARLCIDENLPFGFIDKKGVRTAIRSVVHHYCFCWLQKHHFQRLFFKQGEL